MQIEKLLQPSQETITKIESEKGLALQFSFPSREVLSSIYSVFSLLLGNMNRIFLLDTITTILRECILNAVKANSKRVFFKMENADISNPDHYEKIMDKFKNNVVGNFLILKDNLEKSGYKVYLKLRKVNNDIQIMLENDVPILPEEQQRISARIIQAKKFHDFSEAYEEMYDETEGAGLGLILTVMLLKNCGISPDLFKISTDGKKTFTRLLIPFDLKPVEVITEIKKQILKEIEYLPTFPQFITELQGMCDDPEATIDNISIKIKSDPSLTADILKLANSAGFVSVKRIENISEALMRIGLKNLKYILFATSSLKIMEQRYKKFEAIWNHCLKVAFYARYIAIKYKHHKSAEKAFVSGILHDIGKIVLLAVNLELTNWIADFVKHRAIRTTTILEEVSIGISHSEIGHLIAEKWNFASFLTEAIMYHHAPLLSQKENETIVYATYLANQFCGVENKKYEYYFINYNVKKFFNIVDEAACMSLHEELQNAYQNQPE